MHLHTPLPVLLSFLALTSFGCGTKLVDIGSEVGDESAEETASSGESGSQEGDGAGLVEARGISIVEVEANQAVQIPLTEGAEWIGPESRVGRLVGGRDTLLRVHWEVAEGWQPHPVTFRLRLGPDTVAEQTVEVEGDSARTSMSSTVNFILAASEGYADPGLDFSVELLESEDDSDLLLDALAHVAPADGPAPIGFESGPMEFEVVFVPVHYTGGGLDTQPEPDAESLAPILDRLYELYPISEVVWSVHEPLEVDVAVESLGQLLPMLQSLRTADEAEPQVYYHALIDPGCTTDPCLVTGTAGISYLPGATKAEAGARVAASSMATYEGVSETIVHELGHSQGLVHGFCPTQEAAGAEPNYPHPEGLIGAWGYGLRSGTLHNPATTHSFMSYCPDPWVSRLEWNLLFERVETLTAWAYE